MIMLECRVSNTEGEIKCSFEALIDITHLLLSVLCTIEDGDFVSSWRYLKQNISAKLKAM